MLRTALILVATCIALFAANQEPAELAAAKAIDQESRQLKELPDDVRALAIKSLAARIRQQPARYAISLADNLVVDGTDGSDKDVLQEIADTIVFVLPAASPSLVGTAYRHLAELARYSGVRVTIDNPQYSAALSELDAEEQSRRSAEFRLTDIEGNVWTRKGLRDKVVLINLWSTTCPPCRKEFPDLQALYARYGPRGLVVLAISDDDADALKRFVAEQKLSFPVLMDPGQKVKAAFKVTGTPATFVYDRSGQLVGQAPEGRPSMRALLDMLAKADHR